jgi:hypothetical protein
VKRRSAILTFVGLCTQQHLTSQCALGPRRPGLGESLGCLLPIYRIGEEPAYLVRPFALADGLRLPRGRSIRSIVVVAGRCVVSFQITILKVLAGQPDGRASHPEVTRSVAILMSSGADWSARMKRLAARAPDLSIFSSNYVMRDAFGWQITDAGRAFLASIEVTTAEPLIEARPEPVFVSEPPSGKPSNVIELAHHQDKRRGRAAA